MAAYTDADPEADAKLSVADGVEFQGVDVIATGKARAMVEQAVKLRDSGKYDHISVWIERSGIIHFTEIETLHDAWSGAAG